MNELECRIAALEAEVRTLRGRHRTYARVAVALAGLLALAAVSGRTAGEDASFETVRARRFVLVDEEGGRLGELGEDERGAGSLALFGAGRGGEGPYASLATERGGGKLDLGPLEGAPTATLGVTGFGEAWGGFLRLSSDGSPVVNLWTEEGTANLHMLGGDDEGAFLCGTRSVSSGRAGWIELRNGKGEPAVSLLADGDGAGRVELHDGAGETRAIRAREAEAEQR